MQPKAQRSGFFRSRKIESKPMLTSGLLEVEAEVVVIQVLDGRLVDFSLSERPSQQFEAIELGAVEDIASLRIADIVPQHHHQLVLLQLVVRKLADVAVIALQGSRGVSVEANEVLKHAFRVGVAKDRAFEWLFGPGIDESNGYEVFEAEKRVVLKHLQPQQELIVMEVSLIVKIFVELQQLVCHLHCA